MSEQTTRRVRRHLAAILVAGYSRLFPGDEADSLAALTALLTDLIEPLIPKFGGHVVNWTGERMLSEFDSVVVACDWVRPTRFGVSSKGTIVSA